MTARVTSPVGAKHLRQLGGADADAPHAGADHVVVDQQDARVGSRAGGGQRLASALSAIACSTSSSTSRAGAG